MTTELLKEQYNLLLQDQKNKLQKLREKKQLAIKQPTDNDAKMTQNEDIDENNDIDLSNDVFSKFDSLPGMDSDSDNEPIVKSNNINKLQKETPSKIIVKKNTTKNPARSEYSIDLSKESESLNDKLRELKDENGRFRKLLAEKEYEINYLKKKMDNEQFLQGMGPISGDAAATKIVELAKKVRELTSNLESEKTKNKQISKTNKDLETQLIKSKEKPKEFYANDEDNQYSDDEQVQAKISLSKENKELKEKLNQATHKMMEFKSQTECLKQDLKKYQKALEKEVGENVDIKSILAGNASNWKGRQQQIRALQNKINDLKHQVGMMDARNSQMLDDEDLDETNTFMKGPSSAQFSNYTLNNSMSTNRTNVDPRQKTELKKYEKERREQFEKLKKDTELMEAEINSMKEKNQAVLSRNKVLANENKSFKDQIKVLLEKGKHDNELIEALLKKQQQLKTNLEYLSSEKEKASRQVEDKSKESQIKAMQEKNTIEQLKAIIVERENKVKMLENELERVTNRSGSPQFFLNNDIAKAVTESSFELDAIKNRPPSTPSNFQRSNQFDIERENSRASLRNVLTNQRSQSSNVLNAKFIEQQKEKSKDLRLEISEMTTLYKTSEVERVRLLELVKTLQKRIEDLNEKAMDSENKLNEQRRRFASSEKQVERLKISDSKAQGGLAKQKTLINQSSNAASSVQMDQFKMDELETSLLIQKDENDALKAALKSTLEAKEEDLRLYVEMLESTKRVFLDGLKQYKQKASE